MAKVQTIKTESGEELVVLTRADYDALVACARESAKDIADVIDEAEEEAADAAIYDMRKAALTEGRDAVLPGDVSAALLRGDTLIKALRKWRGISQTDLAAATDLGQGYLSDLESGRRRGTDETLQKIAAALAVNASWLVQAK